MELRKENLQKMCTHLITLDVCSYENKSILKVEQVIKRIVDIIISICGIIVLIPLTLFIWIANFISRDKGTLFYSHERIGKNGKHFKMYKFRSMCLDADAKLEKLLKEDENARREWEKNQKLHNDPRITKIGRFIRKTSLDEFPQFINVLKGDMSLIRSTSCG